MAKAKKAAPKGYEARPWLKLVPRPKVTEDPRARLYFPKASKRTMLELRGDQIESSPVEMGLDQAATVSFSIKDPVGDVATLGLLDVDEDLLLDGIDVRWSAIWWRVARIERAEDGWLLVCEDRAAAYMRSHRQTVVASRAAVTRAGFVFRLVASIRAGGGVKSYIPELNDRQRIAAADVPDDPAPPKRTERRAKVSSSSGWGDAAGKVRMKGRKLSSSQLRVLDEGLTEAARLKASKRVMMAVAMAMTQESELGDLRTSISGRHKGVLHQEVGRGWARTVESANDVAASVRRFLTGGDLGAPGWKQRHGSVKAGSGNLGSMIDAVQVAGTPTAFGVHEGEAKRNVELWMDRNTTGSTSGATASDGASETYYRAQYAFRTGDKANPSNWWDATGELAEEVAWHRWAVNNTIGYASDDEMIRGNPALYVSRSRPEVHDLQWSWDYRREASELVATVALESTFALLPGMVAMVDDEAPVSGRWLIDTVSVDPLAGNIARVQLRRRGAKLLEPAPEVKAREKSSVTVGGKASYGDKGSADDVGRAVPASGSISTAGGAKGIVEQAAKLAARAGGSGVYVGSALRPGSTTSSGNPSDHGANDTSRAARDIGVSGINLLTGPPSSKLDVGVVAIGKALGRDYGTGKQRIVDTFQWRGYRIQIIWRTPEYGGHMGHIHIGARRN